MGNKIMRYGAGGTWVTVMDSDLYVAKAGDTMTGALTIPNGSLTGHAVNKGQMDTADATLNTAIGLRVLKAGDTMTGNLTVPTGTAAGHAVTKAQMDTADAALSTAITTGDALKVAKAGDTMTGALTLGVSGVRLFNDGQYGGLKVGPGASSAIEIYATDKRPYYSWYGGTDNARRGYLGYPDTTSNGSILNAEGGRMWVQGVGLLLSSTGSLDIQSPSNYIYHNAPSHVFRNGAGTTDWVHIDALGGIGGIYFTQGSGGIYMSDTTWVRVYNGKSFSVPGVTGADGGLSVANGGSQSLFGVNWKTAINDGANGVGAGLGVYGQTHLRRPNYAGGTDAGWSTRTLILSGQTGQPGDNVGISMWVDNIAPIISAHAATGEKVQFLNNSNSTAGGGPYIPVLASAFTVSSSLRAKIDITRPEDDELLGMVKQVSGIKFRRLERPGMMHPNARFQEVDAAWQAKGHSPLERQPKHMEPGEHDCAIADCIGTVDDPCCIILNDTDRYGLAAEELYKILPEVVELDPERKPAGFDVDQVAALALTTVGALTRKVEALEARLAELEVA